MSSNKTVAGTPTPNRSAHSNGGGGMSTRPVVKPTHDLVDLLRDDHRNKYGENGLRRSPRTGHH